MYAWMLAVLLALSTGGELPPLPTSDPGTKSIYTQDEWDQMEDAWQADKWKELEEREEALDELEAAIDELAVQEAYLKWLRWVMEVIRTLK
jgi:hypothetical protein